MLSSCIKETEDYPSFKKEVRFTLQVQEEGVQHFTRSTNEQRVQDVNIFFYDPDEVLPARHFYGESRLMDCSVLPGRYEVYVVANVQRNMGAMRREKLLSYRIPAAASYTTLPMSGHATVTLEDRTSSVVLAVKRNVAKIVCNISIGQNAPELRLLSVQIMNAASSTVLFADGQAASYLSSVTPSTFAAHENRTATRTFYLMENCQGEVDGITSQQQKCKDYAPQGATFVRIKAQRDGKLVAYDVYLGENNTTNFDVRRNTVQTLHIAIMGENEVDTRIHAFEVMIIDDFPDADFSNYPDEYCINDPGKQLTIEVWNPEKAGELTATVRVLTGDSGAFLFNGQSVASPISIPLDDPAGVYVFDVAYTPGTVYTPTNHQLVYEVSVKNEDGYNYTETFTRNFYNLLTVYTYWPGKDRTAGRIGDVTCVKSIKTWNTPQYYSRYLSLSGALTLPVIPNDGFAFKGFYANKELTQKVSNANPYQHPITAYRETLYTDFVKEWVYIYTKLDEVLLVCDVPYRIDETKQAFIVSPESHCSLSGKLSDNRTVIAWWNDYENNTMRRKISSNSTYSFTATANCTLVPEFQSK